MTKLILLVEDDADVAASVAEVLESEGYGVTIAANGRDALDELRKGEQPDLILLDMTMPVVDGWGFRAEQLKLKDAAHIPVVTLTADGDASGKAASIGAAGFLAKPVTIEDLLETVERIAGAPELEPEQRTLREG